MTSAVIKFSAILLLVAACVADVVDLPSVKNAQPVTEVCLGCMCQAISGCKLGLQCEGETCGLFRITWAYWADAGKPTINGQSTDDPTAYKNCAVDPACAAQTVQGYMSRFGQDCNGDGVINCYDHMAIHKKGGYGCSGDLPFEYVNVFNQCIAAVAAAQG
ncbi:invertebrate-type lysozyme 3 isoform X1 [Plutella xylostella]|uniref:invertebrate-type lysozyme 3 isoform X1 n=1 Tax=Plutella xylostella TaxID=51655 RepID=UPI002032E4A1|nr:invertebrate-type lysozyme 3 isoform X1 [Plutella xylostella]